MEMKETIIEVLKELRPDIENFEGVDLVADGMLDSFDVVSLMLELNEQFNIEIGVESVSPENFNTIPDIIDVINKTKEQQY